MPSLRTLLLARHREIDPQLDRLRLAVLQTMASTPEAARPALRRSRLAPRAWCDMCLRELFWPCRGIWAALAAIWVVLLTVNALSAERNSLRPWSPLEIAVAARAWQEQQRLLTEFLQPAPSTARPPSPPAHPGPTSLITSPRTPVDVRRMLPA